METSGGSGEHLGEVSGGLGEVLGALDGLLVGRLFGRLGSPWIIFVVLSSTGPAGHPAKIALELRLPMFQRSRKGNENRIRAPEKTIERSGEVVSSYIYIYILSII